MKSHTARRTLGILAITAALPLLQAHEGLRAQQPTFGHAVLQTGFMPDPHILRGQSGGRVNAQQVNAQCRGWISPNPSHVVDLRTNFQWLRMFIESQGDTTLMVQTPMNTVICNDDTYGLNPATEGAFRAGTYRIWVGSYNQNEQLPYELKFTEIHSVQPGGGTATGTTGPAPMPIDPGTTTGPRPNPNPPPPQGGGTLDVDATEGNGTPGWIDERLRPDPAVLEGAAGGTIQAQRAADSSCRGHVQSQPDHIMYVQGRARYLRLYVESSSDTTMVIRTPDGRWLCDDDGGEGMNPMLEMDSWPAGQYLLWIGTYQSTGTGTVPYRLMATRNRPGEESGSGRRPGRRQRR